MAYIILPSRRRRPNLFTLDFSHPLAQGLAFAWLPVDGNKKKQLVYNGKSIGYIDITYYQSAHKDSGLSIGRGAMACRGTNYGSNSLYIPSAIFPTSQLSISLLYMASSHTSAAIFSKSSAWNNGVQLKAISAPLYDVRAGNQSATFPKSKDYTWNSFSFYYDGLTATSYNNNEIVSVLSPLSGSVINTQPARLGGNSYDSGVFNTGSVSDFLVHNRPLSDFERSILADTKDPMLGGFIRYNKPAPKFWFLYQNVAVGTPYSLVQDILTSVSSVFGSVQDSTSKLSETYIVDNDSKAVVREDYEKIYDANSCISESIISYHDCKSTNSLIYSLDQDLLSKISESYIIFQDSNSNISESLSYVLNCDSLAKIYNNIQIQLDVKSKISEPYTLSCDSKSNVSNVIVSEFDTKSKTHRLLSDSFCAISSVSQNLLIMHDAKAQLSEGMLFEINQDVVSIISTGIVVKQDLICKIASSVYEFYDSVSKISSGYAIIHAGKAYIMEIDTATISLVEFPSYGTLNLTKNSSGSFVVSNSSYGDFVFSKESIGEIVSLFESSSKITIIKIGD